MSSNVTLPCNATANLVCENFFDLPLAARGWTGGGFAVGALVLAVVAALVVHCCHRRGSARARQLRNGEPRDEEAASRTLEAEIVALQATAAEVQHQLDGSHARTAYLERELAASRAAATLLQNQLAAAERDARQIYGDGMRRIEFLERKLDVVEEARDLEAEARKTSYALIVETKRELEALEHLRPLLAASMVEGARRAPPSLAGTSAPPAEEEASSAPPGATPPAAEAKEPHGEPTAAVTGEPSAEELEPAATEAPRAPRGGPSAEATGQVEHLRGVLLDEQQATHGAKDASQEEGPRAPPPSTSSSTSEPSAQADAGLPPAEDDVQAPPPLHPGLPDDDSEYYSCS